MYVFVLMNATQTDVKLQQKDTLVVQTDLLSVLYKENNLTVSCVSDDHKAGEYNGWPHYKFVNIVISKACA